MLAIRIIIITNIHCPLIDIILQSVECSCLSQLLWVGMKCTLVSGNHPILKKNGTRVNSSWNIILWMITLDSLRHLAEIFWMIVVLKQDIWQFLTPKADQLVICLRLTRVTIRCSYTFVDVLIICIWWTVLLNPIVTDLKRLFIYGMSIWLRIKKVFTIHAL